MKCTPCKFSSKDLDSYLLSGAIQTLGSISLNPNSLPLNFTSFPSLYFHFLCSPHLSLFLILSTIHRGVNHHRTPPVCHHHPPYSRRSHETPRNQGRSLASGSQRILEGTFNKAFKVGRENCMLFGNKKILGRMSLNWGKTQTLIDEMFGEIACCGYH